MGRRNVYLRLLREEADFRRLFLAQVISFGGDWFLVVPLLGLVYDASNSVLATAGVLVANALPTFLFAPFGGTLADRLDRKKIMVVSQLVATLAVLALVVVGDRPPVILALAMVAAVAVTTGFFNPASNGAVPNLVPRERLSAANVLIGSTWGTMAAVGSALGGVVATAFGRRASFVVDAASFVIAAFLVARIRRPLSTGNRASGPVRTLHALRQAGAYAAGHRPVAALLTAKSGFGLFGAGAMALLPVLSVSVFAAGDRGTGLLFGARGLGALIGPFLARRLAAGSDRKLLGMIGPAMALWGVGYVAVAGSPGLALAALAVLLAHLGGGTQWALSTYGLQALTPDDVRGRIFGFDTSAFTLLRSVSQLGVGALGDHFGTRPLIAWLGVAVLLYGLVWKGVTEGFWRRLDAPDGERED